MSANVDNLAVGVAYGVKKLKITFWSNLLIAVVSGTGTIVSMSFGAVVGKFLPSNVANILSSGVLFIIGVLGIWEALKPQNQKKDQNNQNNSSREELSYSTYVDDPSRVDVDHSRRVELKEAWVLAFALTINNLASSVGAGMSGLNIPLTAIFTYSFSLLAITWGYWAGDTMTFRISGNWLEVFSGSIMIILGIYEYFN
ncbi:hypothetical protein NIES2101_07510 [Calothrix sp. HK-06]|nr:hypothetical protein NIES2101_07510 [Calothrix sp. HK-06]